VVVVALSFGAASHAGEPAAAAPDLAGEIAWARATWPDTFADVKFETPLATLLAWAPPRGERAAYLYTEDIACRAVGLERDRPEPFDDGTTEPATTMTARLRGPTRIEHGREARSVKVLSVGDELTLDVGSFPTEEKDARGRWRRRPGTAIGIMPEQYGYLSHADESVARWDADPLRLRTACKGPTEPLACAGGGERPCQRCDRVLVYVVISRHDVIVLGDGRTDATGLERSDLGRGPGPPTCHDPCPRAADGPDIARLRALVARVGMWRPGGRPAAEVASLYRSHADCVREHPPRRKRPLD
jgi:hypothetical protein